MNDAVRPCPVCGSREVRTIGPIAHSQPALVAGVEIRLGSTEYWLRGCRQCGFEFKDPPIPEELLMECYRNANSENWGTDPDPRERQFDVLRDDLDKLCSGRRVLDVGCFTGALLNYLGENWQKFGVEPSTDAARLAETRNIQILAPSLDRIDRGVAPFDAVLAIDVAEHIPEPIPFFQQLSDLVAPGGVVMILTGDNQSFAWRLQNSRYWYVSLPEHVSFYGKRSMDKIGELVGMRGVEYRRLCHKRLPLKRWCRDMLKSAVYIAGRKAGGFGIPALQRQFVDRRGPTIQAASDHLLYVYRKP